MEPLSPDLLKAAEMRQKYKRWQYRAPSLAGRVHRITVNLKTGERTVERVAAPARPVETPPAPPPRIYILDGARPVLLAVAEAYDISHFALTSRSHKRGCSWPRMAVYRLLWTKAGYSTTRIGKMLDRDHTTVLTGIRKADRLLVEDPEWARCYRHAEQLLNKNATGAAVSGDMQ